jgi:glycosyltransferase involved in cell wall biosynthesis
MYGYAMLNWDFPTLLTVHGILHQEGRLDYSEARLPHRVVRKVKGLFNTFFETRTLRHARHVVAISPYVTSTLNGFYPETLHFIDNPVEDAFFHLKDRAVPNRILFVGMIRARKGILNLVKAVDLARQENPGITLHIVGKVFEPEYDRVLREYVEQNQLRSHVHFLGRVDDRQLFREFEECQVLVLPSAEETSPMVIEQAMAAGKAVIATNVGGIPHLVEDERSGLLVEYGDLERLRQAVQRLLSDHTLAAKFGARGREIATKRFRLEAISAKTRQVYYELSGRDWSRSRNA